ncbi:MAG: DUF4112 domain-containing protein [Gemmatimonadota bacterium]
MSAAPGGRELERFRSLARVWDEAVRVPVLGRVGLDAVVGLVPGLGDIAGGLVAGYGLVLAARLRAPASVLLRMLFNIGIDTLFGVVPLLGDLFDTQWRTNSRNLAILEHWLADPHGARRRNTAVLVGVALGFCVLVILSVWIAVRVVLWLAALM